MNFFSFKKAFIVIFPISPLHLLLMLSALESWSTLQKRVLSLTDKPTPSEYSVYAWEKYCSNFAPVKLSYQTKQEHGFIKLLQSLEETHWHHLACVWFSDNTVWFMSTDLLSTSEMSFIFKITYYIVLYLCLLNWFGFPMVNAGNSDFYMEL